MSSVDRIVTADLPPEPGRGSVLILDAGDETGPRADLKAQLPALAKALRNATAAFRYLCGPSGRELYSNPSRLAIDGHAYTRRLRARVRRGRR